MNINEIMECLPHRYPMLLVDRILEVVPGKSSRGLKNVTMNEAFFQGHYPGVPLMPGVLIIEAMAQSAAIILLVDPDYRGKIPVIGGIDDVKLRRPVVPGDTLIMDGEMLWYRNGVGRVKCTASVEGQVVASMELTFKIIEREK